ncbi:MAG: CPBP family intramembrane metalloprotease [Anaerolineaceae bacterium]|nr:CPBP family intramembrane metalloprotease [Anaerolineaceae bacterium]
MDTKLAAVKSPWKFFWLVFAVSAPFLLVGTVVEQALPKSLHITLPFAALGFVCPMLVGMYLSYRESGWEGVGRLMKRAIDFSKIKEKKWLIPAIFFWPAIMILGYAWMKITGTALPALHFPDWTAPVSLLLFFIGGSGEELGWMGYAIDPLQERRGALEASLILGAVWAVWHIIPFAQAHQSAVWIFWQCTAMLATRILMVWLYNNSGKSVFVVILFHAMYNVISLVFPNYGFVFNPFIFCVLTFAAAGIVILLWGPRTLTHYRYAPLRERGGVV